MCPVGLTDCIHILIKAPGTLTKLPWWKHLHSPPFPWWNHLFSHHGTLDPLHAVSIMPCLHNLGLDAEQHPIKHCGQTEKLAIYLCLE